MRKRILQALIVFFLILVLSVQAVTIFITDPAPVDVSEVETEEASAADEVHAWLADREKVSVTVLGDSIAKGYSKDEDVEITPYGTLVMEAIAAENGVQYELRNYGKNGLDSERMNTVILADDEVRRSLASSDVIFITVGSNDLMNEFKNVVREILETDVKFKTVGEAMDVLSQSMAENPMLILDVIAAIQEWDYSAFEEQWLKMLDTIGGLKKEDAWVVVTNIYNPVANLELPSTMNRVAEDIIRNMNEIIDRYGDEYGYQVADVYNSDICEHVQSDGVHPDQTGQQIIADRIYVQE